MKYEDVDIQKFMDILKKKIENMVYGKVTVEKFLYPSIVVHIYSPIGTDFGYAIQWFHFEHVYDYFGLTGWINHVSKKILDEYENFILKQFVKMEAGPYDIGGVFM